MNLQWIKQGNSHPVYFRISQDGVVLSPDMVADVEICIGTDIQRTYSGGTVFYDTDSARWYTRLRQEDTLAMEPGIHEVDVRVKYPTKPDMDVYGKAAGRIGVRSALSKEVL